MRRPPDIKEGAPREDGAPTRPHQRSGTGQDSADPGCLVVGMSDRRHDVDHGRTPADLRDDSGDLSPAENAALVEFVRVHVRARPPEFGSPAWARLNVDDPRRWSAVVAAAWEYWRLVHGFGSDVLDRAVATELKQASAAISAAFDWRRHAGAPSHAALERRRAFPVERPGDFPGGRVEAWGPTP